MSHSYGEIIKNGKTVGYYEYNGTSDIVLPKIWKTHEEVSEHWREDNPFSRKCDCGKDEPVQIYSSYGNGFWWKGRACLTCMVVTEGINPYDEEIEEHKHHPFKTQKEIYGDLA